MEQSQSPLDLLVMGWELWMNNFGRLVGPVLLWLVWAGVVGPNLEFGILNIDLVNNLVTKLAGVILHGAVIKLFLDIYDSKEFKLENAVLTREIYLNLFLSAGAVFLTLKIENLVFDHFGKLGMVIGFCLNLYLYMRFYFINHLIIDQQKDILSAVSSSWRMTEDVTWELFLFIILTCIVYFLGIIPGVIIGLVFVSIPVVLGAEVSFYRYLCGEENEMVIRE